MRAFVAAFLAAHCLVWGAVVVVLMDLSVPLSVAMGFTFGATAQRLWQGRFA